MYLSLNQVESSRAIRRSEETRKTVTSDSIPPILSFWAYVVIITVSVGAFGFYAYSYYKFFKKFNKEYNLAKQMNHHSNKSEQNDINEIKNVSTPNIADTTAVSPYEVSNQEASSLSSRNNLGVIPKLEISYGNKLKNFFFFKTALIEEKMGINFEEQLIVHEKTDKEICEAEYNNDENKIQNNKFNYFMIKNLKEKNDKLQSIDSVLLSPFYVFPGGSNVNSYSSH